MVLYNGSATIIKTCKYCSHFLTGGLSVESKDLGNWQLREIVGCVLPQEIRAT